jgi:hypothetical protein|nr:MAG TPA: hypothetical protein [Caudoviricetes sp.]
MEPIISPWIIYALPLVDTLIAVLSLVSMLAMSSLIILYIDDEFRKVMGIKIVKVVWVVFIISTLLAIFIPNKETLIAMYVANQVTPDNLNHAQEIITTIIKQAK